MKRLLGLLACALGWTLPVSAVLVHVYQQEILGTKTNQLSDMVLETGADYTTLSAGAKSGYIFGEWRIETKQTFVNRDELGRAFESVSYRLYEPTTLTAVYYPDSIDTDQDGVADGYEIYWYGNLSQNDTSDTDQDGFSFVQELLSGMNPLLFDCAVAGGVSTTDSSSMLYNPYGYEPLTIRSEPEGALFATTQEYIIPGTTRTTARYDAANSIFAYWTLNGVPQRDTMGRAEDSVAFAMPRHALEVVAVCVTDTWQRASWYWYGNGNVSKTSDTDGDGFSFEQELASGMNPILPDRAIAGGVAWVDSSSVEYNIIGHTCIIRSEPEGAFFATTCNTLRPGTLVVSPNCVGKSQFAYWQINGTQQRDALGRAEDQVSFVMPSYDVEVVAVSCTNEIECASFYWYGCADVASDSDTDGDGLTLAAELLSATNPLMLDTAHSGGVTTASSSMIEVNLQIYESVHGAVVQDKFETLFKSTQFTEDDNSRTFADGQAIWPIVADVTGDGLFDIIVASAKTICVLVNVGTKENPAFQENEEVSKRTDDTWHTLLEMNSTDKLSTLTLNSVPVGALSATVWGEDILLVSDEEGRIWYYKKGILQHKVWGGSYAGFANGLRLAAVDWDDDGDLDCLAGTAEGKLMLLRDPKVGRPTNLKALVGVDNVKLDWDPNQQSRIRGYKVYRAEAGGDDFNSLVSPYTPLPTYRDYPSSMSDFDYKVSSVSRHYVAGNSTPIESESPATEAVRASLGKVSLHWNDVVAKRGEIFSLILSIDNSANLSPDGMMIEIEYDHAVLNLLKTLPSGLFEQGKIAPGSGKLYEYVFEVVEGAGEKDENDRKDDRNSALMTEVAVKSATMYGLNGAKVAVALPEKNATIIIAAESSTPPYRLGDVNGDGVIDTLDVRELARLKNAAGRKWTANQLKAGDFNGNGKLDDADYQALRAMLKEKGVLK